MQNEQMRAMRHMLAFACVMIAAAAIGQTASAFELEPYEYVTAPAGTTALLGYLFYGDHESYSPIGGTTTGQRTGLTDVLGIARGAHYFNLGGVEALVEVLQPYGTLTDGRIGGVALRSDNGFGDTTIAGAVWPVNHPTSQTYLGVALYVTVPDGAYSSTRVLNLGGNRFVYDPQLALHQGLDAHWSFDASGDVLAYGDNNSTGALGSPSLSQHASTQLQTFLNYKWGSGIATSIAYEGLLGGRQFLGHEAIAAKTESQEIRFIGSYAITPASQILGEVNHQVQAVGGFRQDVGVTLRGLIAF